MQNVDSTNITAQITQVAQIIQQFFSFLSCLHLSCRVRISDAWQLEMPWHSGEVGRILLSRLLSWTPQLVSSLRAFHLCLWWKICQAKEDWVQAVKLEQDNRLSRDGSGLTQNFRAFLMPEISQFDDIRHFPQILDSQSREVLQQTPVNFEVNYASLKPSSVDLKREKFQYAFKTLAQFPFFCLHETHCDTRVTIFNRCTVPFFNLLKLLTGIFCQTLQWTWHFYAFLNLETCWFSSVFFTLSWSAAELLQSLYPVHLAACRKVEDQWWVSSEAHRTCGATSHLLSISG